MKKTKAVVAKAGKLEIKKGSRWRERGKKRPRCYRAKTMGPKAVHCEVREIREGKKVAGRYQSETVAVPREDFGTKLVLID